MKHTVRASTLLQGIAFCTLGWAVLLGLQGQAAYSVVLGFIAVLATVHSGVTRSNEQLEEIKKLLDSKTNRTDVLRK